MGLGHTFVSNPYDKGYLFVLTSLYNNYILALGYARRLFIIELVKDGLVVAAVLCTVWYHSVPLLVWGQLGASALTWVAAMAIVSRATGYRTTPYAPRSRALRSSNSVAGRRRRIRHSVSPLHPALLLLCVTTAGGGLYAGISFIFHFPELTELKKKNFTLSMKRPGEFKGENAKRFRHIGFLLNLHV